MDLTAKTNSWLGNQMGLPKSHLDYDLRSMVADIKVNDIIYRPKDDDVFNRSNKHEDLPIFTLEVLAKYKMEHWLSEKETRIICFKSLADIITTYNCLFLRLKDAIFSNLQIIMNPWAELEFNEQIQNIIDKSSIEENVKKNHSN